MAGPVGPGFTGLRERLIETLQSKGIKDLSVLRAFDEVPRHLFVPESIRARAYADEALPLSGGQSISQPFVHARALELLQLTGVERVLEIGTGSAFQTALLATLAAQVFSIERMGTLLQPARALLSELGVRNVSLLLGDGTLGWRDYAPFDAIVVGAGAPHVPPALEEQLAEGGRLLLPIGDRVAQTLTLFTKSAGVLSGRDIIPVSFVPLIGAGGWPPG